jgi:hypothetical protein
VHCNYSFTRRKTANTYGTFDSNLIWHMAIEGHDNKSQHQSRIHDRSRLVSILPKPALSILITNSLLWLLANRVSTVDPSCTQHFITRFDLSSPNRTKTHMVCINYVRVHSLEQETHRECRVIGCASIDQSAHGVYFVQQRSVHQRGVPNLQEHQFVTRAVRVPKLRVQAAKCILAYAT